MSIIGNSIFGNSNAYILLPRTSCGLSSSSTATALRSTFTLADNINNYQYIQVLLYSTWSNVERCVSEFIIVPTYDGSKIQVGIYSDSNTGYYCMIMFNLSDNIINLYRAFYANNTMPDLKIIGIK